MNRIYRVFLVLIMLFIGLNSVNAKNDDFTIEDITIVDESEQVERLNITYDKLGINASLINPRFISELDVETLNREEGMTLNLTKKVEKK